MKKLSFLALLIAGICSAQNNYSPTNQFVSYLTSNHNGIRSIDVPETVCVLRGNPFVEEKFNAGTTVIHGKTDFTAPMRYNAAKGVIEFKADNGITKEILRRPYIKASFGGKIYQILEFSNESETKLGYFNLLSFGKTKLLFRPWKEIILEDNGRQRINGEIYAHYKDVSEYYIKIVGLPAKKVKLNKKSIMNSFDSKTRKLLEFAVKKQQLNLLKEADVVRLLKYYDSIQKNSSEIKEMQS